MINTLKIIFFFIKKYFLIDFIFFSVVIFFPENTFYFLRHFFSYISRVIEITFMEKFPLDSFAFILFCLTWSFRKRQLLNEGLISSPLTYKQIFGRLFVVITFIAMYVDKYILNKPVLEVEAINDKTAIFFELLFCWVIAMTVVEIFNWIIFKLFRL